jgi:hypothetical protein
MTSYSVRWPPTPTAAPSCCGDTLYTSAVWFGCTRLLALRADTRPIVLSERASVWSMRTFWSCTTVTPDVTTSS